ncbi:BT_3928 family protein [Parabacteroides pacaensis]|uniref:BT_3928 family protein n=1 Tax=Parabacteroides pacaensis TaxID=2086575 RepID=UPI000D109713|nr:BT_3928 family protein [Parabacteroides pacaensis]
MVKKIIAEFCRILIGIVFIFSGTVKAIDPVGGAIKFEDYFMAFGLDVLLPFTLVFSFCLAALEFTLGICMLLGVYRRYISFLILVFMAVMTPLTLYLAIANPVSDCGCFGDALVITNWETFFKNIVLLAASIFVFIHNQLLYQVYTFKAYWFVTLYSYIFCIVFAYTNYKNLPIVNFRPYKIGANIPQLMEIPESAPQAEYVYSFIYEKDGIQKEFTLENYPANDSTWKFIDQKSKLIKPGYEPPVKGFTIYNSDDNDITDEILQNNKGVFLLIAPKLESASDSHLEEINDLYDFAKEYGYSFYCLTASSPEQIQEWSDNTGAEYPFCFTDETILKTVIRSNPGVVLLKNGTILAKWSHYQLPEEEKIKPLVEGYLNATVVKAKEEGRIITNLLSFTLPLLLVWFYDFFRNRKKELQPEKKDN